MHSEPGISVPAISGRGMAALSDLPAHETERLFLNAGEPPEWSALLTGQEFPTGNADATRHEILDWWIRALDLDFANPAGALQRLPESFGSARLSTEIRALQFHLEKLKPVFDSLRKEEFSLADAMARIAWHFREQERLAVWKREVDRVSEALRWACSFESRRRYLALAFPAGQAIIDDLRAELLERVRTPYAFTAEAERSGFDALFEKFKRSYIDLYHSRHEDLAQVAVASAGNEFRIDPAALQNLEMLSLLDYAEKRPLNHVRLLGKWLQGSRCELPVRDILEEYPRCYCNFDPTGSMQLTMLVSEINRIVQEGIESFRYRLRKCSRIIIEDLRDLSVDDQYARQIASLLSRGKILPLKRQTIDVLNQVIRRHPAEFISALQAAIKKPQKRKCLLTTDR